MKFEWQKKAQFDQDCAFFCLKKFWFPALETILYLFETKIGKIIEEKNLSDGEFLDKNVVSILKSDNVNNFVKQMEEIQLSPEQKEITYRSFRKEINEVLMSSKSEREKKDYVIKIIRAQLEPATKNEYEEAIKMLK